MLAGGVGNYNKIVVAPAFKLHMEMAALKQPGGYDIEIRRLKDDLLAFNLMKATKRCFDGRPNVKQIRRIQDVVSGLVRVPNLSQFTQY